MFKIGEPLPELNDDVLTGTQARLHRVRTRMFDWFIEHYDEIPEWLREQMRIGASAARTDEHITILNEMYQSYKQSSLQDSLRL